MILILAGTFMVSVAVFFFMLVITCPQSRFGDFFSFIDEEIIGDITCFETYSQSMIGTHGFQGLFNCTSYV